MTDQIYYKVQYPIKKAIESLKKVDTEEIDKKDFSPEDIKTIKNFIEHWEAEGENEIKSFIEQLKKNNNSEDN